MDAEQELVYGWLGLNPALLLDPVPTSDNLVVRVVRPGEDAEAVLDEARQQLSAAGPRRRRRQRGGGDGGAEAGGGNGRSSRSDFTTMEANPAFEAHDSSPVLVEITPLPVAEFEPPQSVAIESSAVLSVEADPSDGSLPIVSASEDGDGEPRRRRRRSSAAR